MKKKKKIEQEEPEKWDFRDKMIDGHSQFPSLGAYEYVKSLENIENETEKHHFNEKLDFMKKNEEDKELLEKLQNPPQFSPFDSEGFTKIIGEQAQKTAQVSHDLEMKRIKAKMVADVTVELIKYNGANIFPQRIAEMAREIADNALGNL